MALKIVGNTYKISKKVLNAAAKEAFLYLGGDFEVNLRFLSEAQMTALNKQFRGKNQPTDVLSFKLDDSQFGGDIAICYRVLQTEAGEWGMELSNTAAFLLVHGMLHLADFDHTTDSDRAKMEAAEVAILKKGGIKIER